METQEPKTFTCALCGEEFEQGWTDDEALEELKENFGDINRSECEVVCDDCYKKLMQ